MIKRKTEVMMINKTIFYQLIEKVQYAKPCVTAIGDETLQSNNRLGCKVIRKSSDIFPGG